MSATIDAALWCIDRGIVPVRVGYRDKLPEPLPGWPQLRPTRDAVRGWGTCNLGVLLGQASGWLTDIDLDCPEAVELAPFYLLPTWVFGRKGKPRSHYWYIAEGAFSHKFTDETEATMLEIRGQSSDGSGHQTVIPPSTHVSGEPIEWDPEFADGTDGPRVIDAAALNTMVSKLARATFYMKHGATAADARALEAAHVPKARPKPAPRPRRAHTGDTVTRARQYLAKMPESISHQGGHLALFRAAVAMVKGFELDEATALQLLEEDFNPRCQPEWRTKDLERKVRHAVERSRVPAGYLLDGRR